MNRKSFLLAGGFALLDLKLAKATPEDQISKFGIQLYSVKEDMLSNPVGTLKLLASYGYKQIESYEGDQGMFWGMSNKEFARLLDSMGLSLVSCHYNDDENETAFKKKVELASEIGVNYMITPWMKHQETLDDFKRNAEHFNRYGEICRNANQRFAFHGESPAYKAIGAVIPHDLLIQNTDKNLVDFELDVYYPYMAGININAYLKMNNGRFKLCHLRDVLKTPLKAGTNEESATELGTGAIDFPVFFKDALNSRVNYYLIEQSRFFNTTPMKSARSSASFMEAYISSQNH